MTKTILIVDDDVGARKILFKILTVKGYKVIEAANGKEALDKALEEKPDLVLLDTRLPDINGNEVCRKIKKIKGLSTKVIVYTGYIDAVNAAKAKAAGADDYVVKTSDLSYLLDVIKNLTEILKKEELVLVTIRGERS